MLAIDHVTLRLNDPDAAAAWYESTYGLAVVERLPGEVRLVSRPRASVVAPCQELTLLAGPGPAIDHVAYCVAGEDDLELLRRHLASEGIPHAGPVCREAGMGPTLRLRTPSGLQIEVCAPGRPRRRPSGDAPFGIVRLGHLTCTDPHPGELAAFLTRSLGFRLSDRFADNFVWLRCNRDHHCLACARDAAGMQHFAFEVEGWSEIDRLCDRFRAMDSPVKVEFGPGRHGPGHNIFVYVLDPFGFRQEFFCDLERVDDDGRPEVDWGADVRSLTANRWGPPPPASFLRDRAFAPLVVDPEWLQRANGRAV